MKTSFILVTVGAFIVALPVYAQELQSIQTTEVEAQQGRALLDSDSNETDSVTDPGQTQESADVFLNFDGIEGEAKDDDGDPDQPIIIGTVPNEDTEPEAQHNQTDLEFINVRDKALPSEVGGESEDIGSSNQTPGDDDAESSTLNPDKVEGVVGQDALDDDDDNLGVGDGTSRASKKPKEIVVVGSKIREAMAGGVEVRGWDPVSKEVIFKRADIVTEEDLTDYATALLVSSKDVSSISVRDDVVGLTFDQSVKLFGLFRVAMEQKVDVSADPDEEGRVKVRFPWWSFLAKKDISADEIKAAVADELERDNILDVDAVEAGQEIRRIQTLSNTMKILHDTAMAIIRKIG